MSVLLLGPVCLSGISTDQIKRDYATNVMGLKRDPSPATLEIFLTWFQDQKPNMGPGTEFAKWWQANPRNPLWDWSTQFFAPVLSAVRTIPEADLPAGTHDLLLAAIDVFNPYNPEGVAPAIDDTFDWESLALPGRQRAAEPAVIQMLHGDFKVIDGLHIDSTVADKVTPADQVVFAKALAWVKDELAPAAPILRLVPPAVDPAEKARLEAERDAALDRERIAHAAGVVVQRNARDAVDAAVAERDAKERARADAEAARLQAEREKNQREAERDLAQRERDQRAADLAAAQAELGVRTGERDVADAARRALDAQVKQLTAEVARIGGEKRALDTEIVRQTHELQQRQQALDDMTRDRDRLRDVDLKNQRDEVTRLQGDLATTTRERDDAQDRERNVTLELATARKQVQDALDRVNTLSDDIDVLGATATEVGKQKVLLERQLEALENDKQAVDRQLAAVTLERDTLNQRVRALGAENTRLADERTDARNQRDQVENERDQLRVAKLALDADKQALEARLRQATTDLADREQAFRQKSDELARAIQEKHDEKVALDQQIADLQNRLAEAEKLHRDADALAQQRQQDLASLQADLQKARADAAGLQARVRDLETQLQKANGDAAALTVQLAAKDKAVADLTAELSRLQQELAAEKTLNSNLTHAITEATKARDDANTKRNEFEQRLNAMTLGVTEALSHWVRNFVPGSKDLQLSNKATEAGVISREVAGYLGDLGKQLLSKQRDLEAAQQRVEAAIAGEERALEQSKKDLAAEKDKVRMVEDLLKRREQDLAAKQKEYDEALVEWQKITGEVNADLVRANEKMKWQDERIQQLQGMGGDEIRALNARLEALTHILGTHSAGKFGRVQSAIESAQDYLARLQADDRIPDASPVKQAVEDAVQTIENFETGAVSLENVVNALQKVVPAVKQGGGFGVGSSSSAAPSTPSTPRTPGRPTVVPTLPLRSTLVPSDGDDDGDDEKTPRSSRGAVSLRPKLPRGVKNSAPGALHEDELAGTNRGQRKKK